MVDKAAHGAAGEPFVMDIERGKVHEFARATGSEHQAYFTGDAPVVPPTFLTTQFFWEALVPGMVRADGIERADEQRREELAGGGSHTVTSRNDSCASVV